MRYGGGGGGNDGLIPLLPHAFPGAAGGVEQPPMRMPIGALSEDPHSSGAGLLVNPQRSAACHSAKLPVSFTSPDIPNADGYYHKDLLCNDPLNLALPASSPLIDPSHAIDDLPRHNPHHGDRGSTIHRSNRLRPGDGSGNGHGDSWGTISGRPQLSGPTSRRLLGLRTHHHARPSHQRLNSNPASPSSLDDYGPTTTAVTQRRSDTPLQEVPAEQLSPSTPVSATAAATVATAESLSPQRQTLPRLPIGSVEATGTMTTASHAGTSRWSVANGDGGTAFFSNCGDCLSTAPPMPTRSFCASQIERSTFPSTDHRADSISTGATIAVQTSRSRSFRDSRFLRIARRSSLGSTNTLSNGFIQRASHIARQRLLTSFSCCLAFSCNCASPCFALAYYLNSKELEEYRRLYHYAIVPVDRTSPRHNRLIQEYWDAIYPDRGFPGVPHQLWQAAGFQSHDPWTDFRGGGAMALELMVALARRYGPALRKVKDDCVSQISASEDIGKTESKPPLIWSNLQYPYSASFINVEFFLLVFLRLNSELARVFKQQKRRPSAGALTDGLLAEGGTLELSEHSPFRKGPKNATKTLGRLMAMHTELHGLPEMDRFNLPGKDPIVLNPVFVDVFCATCLRVHKEWCKIADVTNLLGFGEVWPRVGSALEAALTLNFGTELSTALQECCRLIVDPVN